jgi:hypothetical protein
MTPTQREAVFTAATIAACAFGWGVAVGGGAW